jgi:cytochrome c2
MASFTEAPSGDSAKGAKIFKTKCAQCHVAEKGGGHKQVLICIPTWPALPKAVRAVGAGDGWTVRTAMALANAGTIRVMLGI